MTDLYKKKQIGTFTRNRTVRNDAAVRLDFSPAAIRRQVFRDTLMKPYFLYPAAAAVLGGLSMILLDDWQLLSAAALIVGSLAAGGVLLLDTTLRRETRAAQYLERLRQILAERVNESIHNLRHDLETAGSAEGVHQLERLQDKYMTFRELLNKKFNENELTYDRYLGMTEQVYLAGLNNLNSIVGILKSVSAMDTAYVETRIQELEQLPAPSAAEKKELSALQKRNLLRISQEHKVNILFTQNEEAMTSIDRLMAALAEMNPSLSGTSMDMDDALLELERLSERSSQY